MDIKKGVAIRLHGLGYCVRDEDGGTIEYLIHLVENKIKAFINLETVPEGLYYEWVDAVCASFLHIQLANGKIENVSAIVKSIQEGDTNVTLDNSLTPEKQLINYLGTMTLSPSVMVRYRVMTW